MASFAFKALVYVVFVLLFLDSGFEIDITTLALMMGLLASPRLLVGFGIDPVRRVLRRRPSDAVDEASADGSGAQEPSGVVQVQ